MRPTNPLKYALWLLGRRAYSEQEIINKLEGKKFPQIEINQVMEKLKNNHLVDDVKFSLMYIRNRDFTKPRSKWLISTELKRRGITKDNIEKGFLQYNSEDDSLNDKDRAQALVNLQLRKNSFIKKDKFEKKKFLLALLARRGFSYDKAREVIDQIKYNEK